MILDWSLSDNNSPQVSRTLLNIIIYSLEFFTSALADGLSLEFEWQ